jgi:hypothetical protein
MVKKSNDRAAQLLGYWFIALVFAILTAGVVKLIMWMF